MYAYGERTLRCMWPWEIYSPCVTNLGCGCCVLLLTNKHTLHWFRHPWSSSVGHGAVGQSQCGQFRSQASTGEWLCTVLGCIDAGCTTQRESRKSHNTSDNLCSTKRVLAYLLVGRQFFFSFIYIYIYLNVMKLKPKVTLIKTSFTPRPYRPQPLPYEVQILYPSASKFVTGTLIL